MSNRGLRVLLIVTAIVIPAALVQDFRFGASLALEHESANQIARDIQSIDVALADIRASQAAYVATGQGPAFWMKRVTELSQSIDGSIERLRSATTNAEARAQYDAAAAALDDLNKTDRKARDYVGVDQRFLASDMIFVDSLEAGHRAASAITAAGAAEDAAAAARLIRLGRFRSATIIGTLVWGMLVAVILFARATRHIQARVDADAPMAAAALPEPASAAPEFSPAVPAAPLVNLPEVAELCVDFARVFDGRDVPALLDRTVKVLDARGLVLWVIDTSGTFLRPWLLNGYPEKVAQRLGALQVDADNMTSLAFRSMQAQSANSRSVDAFGAIAVPLVTSTGCVGVLAAELRRPRPDRDTVSAARMIAAQLAALATPASDSATVKAAQA